jgi:small subunit ribosomal protein S1
LKKEILEAKVSLCDLEHNLIVDLGCMKGVIKREEGAVGIDTGKTKDIALISRVNKPVCFRIKGFSMENGKSVALLSRKDVQTQALSEYVCKLRAGDVVEGRITHLESFGCFVDICCGIVGLLPIDSISVSRISHPRDRFKVGDLIKVVIKNIDEEGKITLTHKELLGSWEENAENFNIGETVPGIIRSVEEYGVFIELTPNLAGLAEYCDDVKIGQSASVYIKNIIPEKMKIKLIIVDAFDAEPNVLPPVYYEESDHIDQFIYSPEASEKIIRTIFE